MTWVVPNAFNKIYKNYTTEDIADQKSIPLTSLQRSLYNTQKLFPNTPMFNIGGYAVYHVKLDVDKYFKALEKIVNQHQAFKFEYQEKNNDIVQELHQKTTFLMLYSEQYSAQAALSYIDTDMKVPININEQLFRFTVFKLSEETFISYFKVHHIIFDAYSVSILINALNDYYSSDVMSNAEADVKKSAYQDYIMQDLHYKQSLKYVKDAEFWTKLLTIEANKGFENCMLSDSNDFKSARKSFYIKREVFETIHSFCHDKKTTVYSYFIASIYWLNQLYGNERFFLGLPILSRATAVFKNAIGPFINVLPFILANNCFNTFNELLNATQQFLSMCYRYSKYPYTDAVLKDHHNGLKYNVCFSYQKTRYAATFDGEATTTHYLNNGYQQEDLLIHLIENKGDATSDIAVHFDYRVSKFQDQVIAAFIQHFELIVTSMHKRADLAFSAIEFMPREEKNKILFDFNRTEQVLPKANSVMDIIETMMLRKPDNTAALFANQSITYKELEVKSRQLGGYLQSKGMASGVLVGVLMERSLDMVIAIISILRSGGIYVPLDPEYPKERLHYMVGDSNCSVIITHAYLSDMIVPQAHEIVLMDNFSYERNSVNGTCPRRPIKMNDRAYMIYTSGSTGTPKGVMNTHIGLLNRINWMQKALHLEEHDVVLQKTPFSFDVSIWEFIWPLTVGAALVLAKPKGHKEPLYLIELINTHKVSTIHFVPSMLQIFLSESSVTTCTTLTRMICSGEALTAELMNACLRKLNVNLYNLYGPTEASIDVTCWTCHYDETLKQVPIGKPIDNTEIYILGPHKQVLPVGVSGELYISGVGVAEGYHNNPHLTSEKFILDPFKSGTMYRSGDLARWRTDGNIEYMGRIDHQIKINGLRIELGEIEFLLNKHPHIASAKVIDVSDHKGGKHLVAYLTMIDGAAQYSKTALHKYLQDHLPFYMIPTMFVVLEALPLTSSGKLDRKSLPKVDYEHKNYIEPKTEQERALAAIFMDILGLEKIGITDSFFEFGGTSLKAIQFVSRYAAITIHDLYLYPSIQEILAYLETQPSQRPSSLVHLGKSKQSKYTLVCIPYGGGEFHIYQGLAASLTDDFSVYAVDVNRNQHMCLSDYAQIIAKEISDTISNDIILYGHCVGCALTYEIAKFLEHNKINIRLVIMAATAPYLKNKAKALLSYLVTRYAYATDKKLFTFLKKLGGFSESTHFNGLEKIFENFRRDVLAATQYFNDLRDDANKYKLRSPLVSIIGSDDHITKWFLKEVKNWDELSCTPVKYYTLSDANHYFIHTHVPALIELIKKLPRLSCPAGDINEAWFMESSV